MALSVAIKDVGGQALANALGITVADATLSALQLTDPHTTEALGTGTFTVATFHDAALGTDATDFTATITWGDSSPDSAASVVSLGNGNFALTASHTYAEEGNVTLSVSFSV